MAQFYFYKKSSGNTFVSTYSIFSEIYPFQAAINNDPDALDHIVTDAISFTSVTSPAASRSSICKFKICFATGYTENICVL